MAITTTDSVVTVESRCPACGGYAPNVQIVEGGQFVGMCCASPRGQALILSMLDRDEDGVVTWQAPDPLVPRPAGDPLIDAHGPAKGAGPWRGTEWDGEQLIPASLLAKNGTASKDDNWEDLLRGPAIAPPLVHDGKDDGKPLGHKSMKVHQ
jgi:hypothetical protein